MTSREPSADETEAYVLELWGLPAHGSTEHMRAVGTVLAGHPSFTPTTCGLRDPARTRVADLTEQLATLGEQQKDRVQAAVHLARPEAGESGTVTFVADPFRGHPPGFVRPSKVELTLAPAGPAQTADLAELLGDLAEATEGFYGFVSSRRHVAQLRGPFGAEQRRRYGPAPSGGQPPTWQPPPFQALEMALPDVFWVQVLGPAFVGRWGDERLATVGTRRRRLSNGGYLVWASDDPPAADDGVQHPEAHPWKASLYDPIGPEPFVRHDHGWNEFGAHVPLMTDHAAAVVNRSPGQVTTSPAAGRGGDGGGPRAAR